MVNGNHTTYILWGVPTDHTTYIYVHDYIHTDTNPKKNYIPKKWYNHIWTTPIKKIQDKDILSSKFNHEDNYLGIIFY